MKILYFSLKGGVGKSSLALNHALENGYVYVTNDISTNIDESHQSEFYQISHNKKRIPREFMSLEEVIFDFGAMSNVIDHKVTQAVKLCDGVVIPTFTDERSLQATIESYNLIKNDAKSIVIVINNYTQEKKYLYACEVLNEALGNPVILDVRTTTLFERVAKDGAEWFKNINNGKGEFQLAKTKETHQSLYNEINYIIGHKHG